MGHQVAMAQQSVAKILEMLEASSADNQLVLASNANARPRDRLYCETTEHAVYLLLRLLIGVSLAYTTFVPLSMDSNVFSFGIQALMLYAHVTIEILGGVFLILEGFHGSRVPFYEGRIHWLNRIGIAVGMFIFYMKIGTLREYSGDDDLNRAIACLLTGNLITTLLIFVGMMLEHGYKAFSLEASAMWTTINGDRGLSEVLGLEYLGILASEDNI